jgi:tRNA dimethylallyltransferase
VARELGDIEIVVADAMCVYRGMDIGTAKPDAEQQAAVPHHLLDLADPSEEFSIGRLRAVADETLAGIEARGCRALVVGGSGLWVRAIVDRFAPPPQYPDVQAELDAEPSTEALHRRLADLDPLAASRMEPVNRRRVMRALEVTLGSGRPFSDNAGMGEYPENGFDQAGVWLPREVLRQRIEQRYSLQMEQGFLDEVRSLFDERSPSRTAAQALGYKELAAHLRGEATLDEALATAISRTRGFARRQRVWFRRDPRITWLGVADDPARLLPALLGQWGRR